MQRFMVVGHPRSGSTFVVERIVMTCDAFAPNVNHQELFNVFERLFNAYTLRLDDSDEPQMIADFFARSTQPMAGFKTIPSFHRQWEAVAEMPGVAYITVQRRDVLSTIAAMLVCERHRNWAIPVRRQLNGSKYLYRDWFESGKQKEMILGELLNRLLFDLRVLESLNAREDTVQIIAEELDSRVPRLEACLGQEINFQGFRPPTHMTECFEDADEFRDDITRLLKTLLQATRRVPRLVANLFSAS